MWYIWLLNSFYRISLFIALILFLFSILICDKAVKCWYYVIALFCLYLFSFYSLTMMESAQPVRHARVPPKGGISPFWKQFWYSVDQCKNAKKMLGVYRGGIGGWGMHISESKSSELFKPVRFIQFISFHTLQNCQIKSSLI